MPYLGNIPATQFAELKYQDFTGGTGTSFTLNDPVGSAQELEVFVNNVRQEPGVAYTVSGTALTMTGSIVATDDFYVVFQGKSIPSGQIPEKQSNGDYTFDDGTLFVDASTNRVGVGLTSPSKTLHVESDSSSVAAQFKYDGSTSYIALENDTKSDGYIGYTNAGKMEFWANGSQRASLLPSGGLTFNGDTAAANALDDYEEGTWTATMGGSTTNPSSSITTTGYYQKIGRLVYLQAQFTNVNTSGAGGGFRITGLPYNPSTATATGNVMLHKRFNASASNTVNICPYVVTGTNHIAFYLAIHNSAWVEVTHNPGNDHYCAFTVVYHTN